MPANGAARPSAIEPGATGTGSPAASASCMAGESSGSTPITRASGLSPRTAVAIPEISPPPPTGTTHHVHVRDVLDHLEPDRALAGDRARVVERVDGRAAGLLDQVVEPRERLRRIGGLEVDLGAVAARRRDLRLARALPHHEQRVEPFDARAPGQRLRVVPGRDPDHAALALLRRQRGEIRQHAARLEGARALEQLRLERDLARRSARSASPSENVGVRCSRPPIASRAASTSASSTTLR